MSDWKFIERNGEKILPIVLFGTNRDPRTLEWHKKVMDYLGLEMNYIYCPFPAHSHGYYMNEIIRGTIDTLKPDYYLFIENDAIFLRKDAFDEIYELVKNKLTIYGQAWQSNHKKGPNGMIPHAYAGPATLFFARELYEKLGKPDFDHHNERSDTAEELTYAAKLNGYTVALMYPSHVEVPNTPLDNGCQTGLGNTYGVCHSYHASQQGDKRSAELFIEKCQDVIEGEYEIRS